MWYNYAWEKRVKVTIDHTKVSGALTDFPAFVNLADLGADFWASVQNGGGDIRVTTADGETECAREVVACDTATDTGELWVKIPALSSTVDTDIFVYYQNATATEPAVDSTYGREAVWGVSAQYIGHFSGNANDSSANHRDGVLTGISTGGGVFGDDLELKGETVLLDSNFGADVLSFGKATNYKRVAHKFTCPSDLTKIKSIFLQRAASAGTLAGNVWIEIWSDSAGSPGSYICGGSYSAGAWLSLPIGSDSYLYVSGELVPNTTYWIVLSSAAPSDVNYPQVYYNASGGTGNLKQYNGSTWVDFAGSLRFALATSDDVALSSDVALTYNSFTISWKLKKTSDIYESLFSRGRGGGEARIDTSPSNNNVTFESRTNNLFQKAMYSGVDVDDGTYHYYKMVSAPDSFKFYVDGVLRSTQTPNTDTLDQLFRYIGTKMAFPYIYGRALTGFIDEVRFLSNKEDSFDVTATEYNNQNDPATFYTVATAQTIATYQATKSLGYAVRTTKQGESVAQVEGFDATPYDILFIREGLRTMAGQTFTVDAPQQITKGSFLLKRQGTPTGLVTARIYDGDTLVATSTSSIDITTITDSADHIWYDFDFDNVPVVSGTTYTLVVHYNGSTSSLNCLQLWYVGSTTGDDGVMKYYSTSWQTLTGDVPFAVYALVPAEYPTKELSYYVRQNINVPKPLQYAVFTDHTVQKSLAYNITHEYRYQKTAKYAVKTQSVTTKSLAYYTRGNTNITKSLRYVVRVYPYCPKDTAFSEKVTPFTSKAQVFTEQPHVTCPIVL